jgi:aminomethyltransferase
MHQTPLHDEYAKHGGKVVDFHGWALPVQFSGIVDEHLHTREKAGLFDCSHMGEFLLQGKEAIAAFDRLVYSDMITLGVGRCRYSAILNDDAGIVDDCVGLRLSEDEMYLVTNAGPLSEVEALVCAGNPGAKQVSHDTAKIDLQGPLSRDILIEAGIDGIAPLKYWQGGRMQWKGHEIIVTRAGYTGELGYEIFVPNEMAAELWQALAQHPQVKPCGLGARDTLRLEMGYPLNGEDLNTSKTPLESGMERFICWDKNFIGKSVLEAQREHGEYTRLTAIVSKDRRAPRHGFDLVHNDQIVGAITSGTYGPSVGLGVALADVGPDYCKPGQHFFCGPKGMEVETAEIPIYKGGTCRIKI